MVGVEGCGGCYGWGLRGGVMGEGWGLRGGGGTFP